MPTWNTVCQDFWLQQDMNKSTHWCMTTHSQDFSSKRNSVCRTKIILDIDSWLNKHKSSPVLHSALNLSKEQRKRHKDRSFSCEITKTVPTLAEISNLSLFYLCSQGEAGSWREQVNGAKSSLWLLCRDHKSTHHLSHVVLIGPESGSLHMSQTDAL